MLCSCIVWCFFFFKQKTAYEMRISDWSSDVCSSDLPHLRPQRRRHRLPFRTLTTRPLTNRISSRSALERNHLERTPASSQKISTPPCAETNVEIYLWR